MTGLEKLVDEAKTDLTAFFHTPKDERTSDDRKDARISGSILSTHAKLVQADSGMAMVICSVARDIAENKDELRRLVQAALPDNPVTKLLKGK